MSAPHQPGPPSAGPRSVSNGPQGVPMNSPHPSTAPAPSTSTGGSASQADLNKIVIEYLIKKGYSKTEAALRNESSNVDAQGYVITRRAEDRGGEKWRTGYVLLSKWIEDSLEIYKPELKRLLWPVFVYSFLSLVHDNFPERAKTFFDEFKAPFESDRAEDLKSLEFVRNHDHIETSPTAKAYWKGHYRLTLTSAAHFTLIQFLEAKEMEGGSVILTILSSSMDIKTIDRAAGGSERMLAAMMSRDGSELHVPEEDEGIPGHNPGSANTDKTAPPVLTRLSLGTLPMDAEMSEDLRDELEEEDSRKPRAPGQDSLVDIMEQRIKREPSEDGPSREAVPLPKPLARDVEMEVRRIKEHRDRFAIPPRSNGVGPGVSVTMFTFHNTFDSINCLDFSGDNALVAAGMAESYIRVWSLEGKPLPSLVQSQDGQTPNLASSRRLIGHSGPVYGVSFSPSVANDGRNDVSTSCRYLLSSSADKTVRLWSLDTWSCLVVYKGHDHPVWDVTWGPFGHYFVSGSHDTTARLWSTDHIAPLRIFAGHDQDVDCVTFHPNNTYVFTGSSDKTVRMWDVSRGSAVRLFTGHMANLTCVSCAPSGKILASADDSGVIMLWDLGSGRRIKRMRGHTKGGIWSLSWSAESSLLVSGGADSTVRVWDVFQQTEGSGAKGAGEAGAKADGSVVNVAAGVPSVVSKKNKGKDVSVTPDQISAFPTKKSPVYRVQFTNMNLVLAGGAYMP